MKRIYSFFIVVFASCFVLSASAVICELAELALNLSSISQKGITAVANSMFNSGKKVKQTIQENPRKTALITAATCAGCLAAAQYSGMLNPFYPPCMAQRLKKIKRTEPFGTLYTIYSLWKHRAAS